MMVGTPLEHQTLIELHGGCQLISIRSQCQVTLVGS
jgi:hypothetical protein